jgi:hypothetical protein
MGIMKFNKWTQQHTKGLIVGLISPLIFVPLTILIFSLVQNYDFDQLWHRFILNRNFRGMVISVSVISNLIWFYLSLNREKYAFARAVIIATFCFVPYIIYVKFIA